MSTVTTNLLTRPNTQRLCMHTYTTEYLPVDNSKIFVQLARKLLSIPTHFIPMHTQCHEIINISQSYTQLSLSIFSSTMQAICQCLKTFLRLSRWLVTVNGAFDGILYVVYLWISHSNLHAKPLF